MFGIEFENIGGIGSRLGRFADSVISSSAHLNFTAKGLGYDSTHFLILICS